MIKMIKNTKKGLLLVIVGIIFLISVKGVLATVYYNESFTETNGTNLNGYKNWTVTSGTASILNNMVKVNGGSSSGNGKITGNNASFVNFTFRCDGNTGVGTDYHLQMNGLGHSRIVVLGCKNDNNLYFNNGDLGCSYTRITPGADYEIIFRDIDYAAHTLDVFVNGTIIANNCQFAVGSAGVGSFSWMSGSTVSDWYFDSICVSDGEGCFAPEGGIIANESQGIEAIEQGIAESVIGNTTAYTYQKVYASYSNGTQSYGAFDKIALYGYQRWAINYVTEGESYVNMPYMTPVLYVMELENRTMANITSEVSAFINSTYTP